jgi:hypothetical protein
VLRFVVLSIVMAYFYNRAGESTLIAIAMHGLHNDAVGLMGRITGEGLVPYIISELALLAPIAASPCGCWYSRGAGSGSASPRKTP